MAYMYHTALKVDRWVIVNQECPKLESVIKWFTHHGAHHQEWPSTTFINTIMKVREQGWQNAVKLGEPYVMSPDFLLKCAVVHTHAMFGPNTQLMPSHSVAKLNRKVNSDQDYVRLFDDILLIQTPIALSQIFQIGPKCYGSKVNCHLFITSGYANEQVVRNLAVSVITIGEGDQYTINIGKTGRASTILQEYFENLQKTL